MKRIISYVVVGILAAILITVCVLAIVPTNYYNPIEEDGLKRIEIWHNGEKASYNAGLDENDAIIKSVVDANTKGFSEKVLTSIFLGYGANAPKVEHRTATGSEKLSSIISSSSDNYYVVFDYAYGAKDSELSSVKQVLKVNGENYKLEDVEEGEDATVSYTRLILEVSNSKDFGEITVYLEETLLPTSSGDMVSNYRLTVQGYQTELYNVLENLFD